VFKLGRILNRLKKPSYRIHFNDGAYAHNPNEDKSLFVKFLLSGKVKYEVSLQPDHWGKANIRYYAPWEIVITDEYGRLVTRHCFNLERKRVRINIDSKSLGDTLAWIPQVDRFARAHPQTEVYCGHFWPQLGLAEKYPHIHFIDPASKQDDIYATYVIGFYFDDRCQNMHPKDPRTIPLARVASDILGLEYEEVKPILPIADTDPVFDRPTVCFAMESTSGCKLWQREGGWQELVNYLNHAGYRPALIQKGEDQLDNIINLSGDYPITDRIEQLRDCTFFVGLGSGLSWLAWALGKKVVLISGFSRPFAEFQDNCYRVINPDVCHGCWNDTEYNYDRGDWDWCPRYKGTSRQFECSKEITVEQVIEALRALLADSQQQ